jgi:SAM-dependent methyltransferase
MATAKKPTKRTAKKMEELQFAAEVCGVDLKKELTIKPRPFDPKHGFEPKIKLNLGCRDLIMEDGFVNIDLYPPEGFEDKVVKMDVRKLDYPDNSVDEIYALHIIEHFNFREATEVLKEWQRVLKPGGRLYIETPDLLATCKLFVESNEQDRISLYGQLFAKPWIPGDAHYFLFTETQIYTTLVDWLGFVRFQRLPAMRYIDLGHINIGVEVFKA